MRAVIVNVALTWLGHRCVRALATAQAGVQFWFTHNVRLSLHQMHRKHQHTLAASLATLRRPCHGVPPHVDLMEATICQGMAHTATIAGATIHHLQVS